MTITKANNGNLAERAVIERRRARVQRFIVIPPARRGGSEAGALS